MPKTDDLFTTRKSLDLICEIPQKIISVYSLEKHVWADSNHESARKNRQPNFQTIEEFQIDPVRPFLNDVLRNMAAPYKADNKENPIGQGYWIQAEFGSGKSHLLCFLAALALGNQKAWDMIKAKEAKEGKGTRESIYTFWENGLAAKSSKGKGIFTIVTTLVGVGGGIVGQGQNGKKLVDYILDAAREQVRIELGKNLSLYPAEMLADRFIQYDLERYRNDLRKFLRDPKYFPEGAYMEVDEFIRHIQDNKVPAYKESCGAKLWIFYTEYLKVDPHIEQETEEVLKHMVEAIMAEGYTGVLLVLDEVSLFMVNRPEGHRWDDAKTLVILANRIAKIHNLPLWTVCSAQNKIDANVGDRNIIADDRLKLVQLLKSPEDYFNIVLSRVRKIKDPGAISNYYLYYKKGFTWPNNIGEEEFRKYFPFHKPALEVLYAITYKLTTARSAITVLHQVLKHQMANKGNELIRLWELFDETVHYEEEASGTYASLTAIKSQFGMEYGSYENCRNQIDAATKGVLKVYREKSTRVLQTLFLYHVAKVRQQGITPDEIANSILIGKDTDSTPEDNVLHYEHITESLRKELYQINQSLDENNRPRYRFEPAITAVRPQDEFRKAIAKVEANEALLNQAWISLLGFKEWKVRSRQMSLDLANGLESIFKDCAPGNMQDFNLCIHWLGKEIFGLVEMADFGRTVADNISLRPINTDQTDLDFGIFISTKPVTEPIIAKLLSRSQDPRILFWTPGELTTDERDNLIKYAAYRKLIEDWQTKDTEDASAIIQWVSSALQTEMANILKIVDNSFARGRIDNRKFSKMEFNVAGGLNTILSPIVNRVLNAVYESKTISFDSPFSFSDDEGTKVINGIVKTGNIPKNAKPNKDISAAQNFGIGLFIIKRGAEKTLDISGNQFTVEILDFINQKQEEPGKPINVETIFKNFMGIGGPKDYGLGRRIIQIFLLSLTQKGAIRITLNNKSGLSTSIIDYANISTIDFKAAVLNSFLRVQKVEKPENWDVLRPYAEKLLGETISSTNDEALITKYRAKLRQLFNEEKGESALAASKSKRLFEALKLSNPYEKELGQMMQLFSTNLEEVNDIDQLLNALKEVLNYQAYNTNTPSQEEVDDLANRLKNYKDLKQFLKFDSDLYLLKAYCDCDIPHLPVFAAVDRMQQALSAKINTIQTYIDSEVKLKTELIGNNPPIPGETDTLISFIKEYSLLYLTQHEHTINEIDKCSNQVQAILDGDKFKALKILENITAFQSTTSARLEAQIKVLYNDVFKCTIPSRASVEEYLKIKGPVHECGLSFSDAEHHLNIAKNNSDKAVKAFEDAFNSNISVLLNPTIRGRLERGKSEAVIADLLKYTDIKDLADYLVNACLTDPGIVDTINRYLKKVNIKSVKLNDFKPSKSTFEKDEIVDLALEFQGYLEKQVADVESGSDSVTMIKLE